MDGRMCSRCRVRKCDPRQKWCQICYQESLVKQHETLCDKSCGRPANRGKTMCETCYQKYRSSQPQRRHNKPLDVSSASCNFGKQYDPQPKPPTPAAAVGQAIPEASQKDTKILFVGNPGAGKSTLLNSLIREIVFPSGYSVVVGLTTILQTHISEQTGVTYMDTPGLSDFERRKQAAEEITEALKKDGQYRLFFVITLDSGRVRPDDATTMLLVLNALSGVRHLSFSVVINQNSRAALRKLKEEDNYKTLLASINANLPCRTDRLFLFPEDADAKDCDDVLIDQNTEFTNFVWGAQPVLIKTEQVTPINAETFDEVKQQMKMLTDSLIQDKEKLESLLQLVQKEKEEREAQIINERKERDAQRIKEQEERENERKKAAEEQERVTLALNKLTEQIAQDTNRIAKAEAEVAAQKANQEAENQRAQAALKRQEAELQLAAQRAEELRRQLAKQELERQQQELALQQAAENEKENLKALMKEKVEALKLKWNEAEEAKKQEMVWREQMMVSQQRAHEAMERAQANYHRVNSDLQVLLKEKHENEVKAQQEADRIRLLQEEEAARVAAEKKKREDAQKEAERLRNRPWRHPGSLILVGNKK